MKVYLPTPASTECGGVEAQFQLADAINNLGGESIIIWEGIYDDPIPKKYKHYNIRHSLPIDDSSDNMIIYPEIWTHKLGEYSNMRKAIWWLSVDNNYGRFQDFGNDEILHFCQSYYSIDFLKSRGVKNIYPLFENISEKYLNLNYDISKKIDIVCYNPVKGIEQTNIVKNLNPDIKFVPIFNMNEEEVIELLKISKVYIDFGNHPGRDRIPRESAILGNCIITNLKGSARFNNDILIDDKYKFLDVHLSSDIIRYCINNFEDSINDFKNYREYISNQKKEFYNFCNKYFIK